jgi:hypothetical protein
MNIIPDNMELDDYLTKYNYYINKNKNYYEINNKKKINNDISLNEEDEEQYNILFES